MACDLLKPPTLKAFKILLGSLTAVWAISLIPKVLGNYDGRHDLSFSYHMGAVFGVLFIAAFSIALFRSVFSS